MAIFRQVCDLGHRSHDAFRLHQCGRHRPSAARHAAGDRRAPDPGRPGETSQPQAAHHLRPGIPQPGGVTSPLAMERNGDFPMKNGDCPMKNGDIWYIWVLY